MHSDKKTDEILARTQFLCNEARNSLGDVDCYRLRVAAELAGAARQLIELCSLPSLAHEAEELARGIWDQFDISLTSEERGWDDGED